MKPTPKQVQEISEVLAVLLEDFPLETQPQPEESGTAERICEAAMARRFARSLRARGGEPRFREFLEGAQGMLRISIALV
jgi:hypothetical protein